MGRRLEGQGRGGETREGWGREPGAGGWKGGVKASMGESVHARPTCIPTELAPYIILIYSDGIM